MCAEQLNFGMSKHTLIWMADGSFKKIIGLKRGDLVDTFEGPAEVEFILAHKYKGPLIPFFNTYMAPGQRISYNGASFDAENLDDKYLINDYEGYIYNIVVSNRNQVRIGYFNDKNDEDDNGTLYAGTLGDKELYGKYFWGTEEIIKNLNVVDPAEDSIGYIICESPTIERMPGTNRITNITF